MGSRAYFGSCAGDLSGFYLVIYLAFVYNLAGGLLSLTVMVALKGQKRSVCLESKVRWEAFSQCCD